MAKKNQTPQVPTPAKFDDLVDMLKHEHDFVAYDEVGRLVHNNVKGLDYIRNLLGRVDVLEQTVNDLRRRLEQCESNTERFGDPDRLQEFEDLVTKLAGKIDIDLKRSGRYRKSELMECLIEYAKTKMSVEKQHLPTEFVLNNKQVFEHPVLWVIPLLVGGFTMKDFSQKALSNPVSRVRSVVDSWINTYASPLRDEETKEVVKRSLGLIQNRLSQIVGLLREDDLFEKYDKKSLDIEDLLNFYSMHDNTFKEAEDEVQMVRKPKLDEGLGSQVAPNLARNLVANEHVLGAQEQSAMTAALKAAGPATTMPFNSQADLMTFLGNNWQLGQSLAAKNKNKNNHLGNAVVDPKKGGKGNGKGKGGKKRY